MNKIYALLVLVFPLVVTAQNTWLIEDSNSFDYYLSTIVKDEQIVGSTRKNALKEMVGGLE
ncbi:MAG: hypothetical protein AAF849_06580 [Bacteroidota bacterium]